MPVRVALTHKTTYTYDRLVRLSPQIVRLRPAPHCRTNVLAYSLKVEPKPHFLNWQQDPHSNFLARVVFPERVPFFSVSVDLLAEMKVINPFDFFLEPQAEKFPFKYDGWLGRELAPFLETGPPGPRLSSYLKDIDVSERGTMDFLVQLNQTLQNKIRYLIRMEPGVQSSEETLTLASGSCRDTAWLLVDILRNLGLAARFVSGYLIQLKPDNKPLDGPAGPERDFTDLHAWTEVYLPGAGWIGLDPTSGLLAGEGHLPLAATPDPASAAPVSGRVDECEVRFAHEMSIVRIHEDPRVTLPYTDRQWQHIDALGERIDQDISRHDIRLTMGGEPTFISIDNMDGEEWNTAALGPEKRLLAERLLDRLRERFAPGGLLHYGEGKWYPGEPLPRWALTCYWRADSVPLWLDRSLLARAGDKSNFGALDARHFAETLARRLRLDPENVNPAFEDPLYHLQKERQLPVNVDPVDNRLNNAEDRERLRRVFERGLETPSGMVLPLQRGWGLNGPEWQTGLWMLRGQHLYLIPGDSPLGLRLPLPSLPWVSPEEAPQFYPVDPMVNRGSLPAPVRHLPMDLPALQSRGRRERDRKPRTGESAPWIVRTALCVEPRDGRLHIFMPPLENAEDYIDLLAAIEDTAGHLEIPVVIEGYTPPCDPRLKQIKVTPDPGVIEVNIHPSQNWCELVANTTALYEDARQVRLGAEKFMLDGRHTGTGGGNHFVLGAATPSDSPFLRRPDLLRSMIGYWLNHPSLSYVFSTIFIGPTSQAPRVDETRADSLYELEIAFGQIPDPDTGNCPPWLVDRIFRHILTDVAGNTHRAEFCVDKLYSPDSASGRLGLLELRGFEMPPHARMSLTQQLLVRGLIAWFWRQPYRCPPIHWGTRLHDQFMLPHFTARDFRDVLDDLSGAGYAFDAEWFAPHFEFRYPVFGAAHHSGIDIEIRQATEPWYVLGEEGSAGGTTRYVDSSVERVQVKVNGLTGDRYVVTCNGRRAPLHATGQHDEWVAGVRYRAWQPPSCLHPTIPVHTPLVFDIVDTWTGRSVGGCTYHVAHPAGRNFVTFPVNANEAEARRGARFFPHGHTPGPMEVPRREENPEFPLTLDLRRSRTSFSLSGTS
ncbi:MAG: transglutaminase family protein [Bryobacterales bacterium]|nr:transglutaminase family protein [Bryobacterales bacterium]MBV9401696.1 transglutaminase family protein [Bryobacterales bacterium]